jgi:hypothetical protein
MRWRSGGNTALVSSIAVLYTKTPSAQSNKYSLPQLDCCGLTNLLLQLVLLVLIRVSAADQLLEPRFLALELFVVGSLFFH